MDELRERVARAIAVSQGQTWDQTASHEKPTFRSMADAALAATGAGHAWKLSDGDTVCQECGAQNPNWFAPSEVWNFVVGGPDARDDPGGVLCPNCFLRKAGKGVWEIRPHAEQADAAPVTVTVQEAAEVLLDADYLAVLPALGAIERLDGEGADRQLAAALHALASQGDDDVGT